MESRERYNRLFALYSQIIYDRIRDTGAEVDFLDRAFQSLAQIEVKRVLDIACGTGRHAIPLTRRGYRVVGVDLSPAMLSRCAEQDDERSVPLVQCDMRFLPFGPDAFDAMFCMFSSFNHLNENREILTALRGFYESLRPGGILILDLINPLKFLRIGFKDEEVHIGERDGIYVERRLSYRIDEVNAIWRQTEHTIIKTGSEILENREIHLIRLLTYPEIRHLLETVGFGGVRCYGSFRARERAMNRADRLITLALKPKGG
jgi:SAM-dependent methyltransferase